MESRKDRVWESNMNWGKFLRKGKGWPSTREEWTCGIEDAFEHKTQKILVATINSLALFHFPIKR